MSVKVWSVVSLIFFVAAFALSLNIDALTMWLSSIFSGTTDSVRPWLAVAWLALGLLGFAGAVWLLAGHRRELDDLGSLDRVVATES